MSEGQQVKLFKTIEGQYNYAKLSKAVQALNLAKLRITFKLELYEQAVTFVEGGAFQQVCKISVSPDLVPEDVSIANDTATTLVITNMLDLFFKTQLSQAYLDFLAYCEESQQEQDINEGAYV